MTKEAHVVPGRRPPSLDPAAAGATLRVGDRSYRYFRLDALPVSDLARVGQQIQSSTGALLRVNEVLESRPEVDERADAEPLPPLSDEIRLEQVTFSVRQFTVRYEDGDPVTIRS
jgi:ABC-type multidrug transport system fused ATPase/permease subunit